MLPSRLPAIVFVVCAAILPLALVADAALVAHYALDGDYVDSIGGYNGTHQGTAPAAFVASPFGGQAIDLDGVDQYILTTGVASSLGIDGNNPRTIMAWFRTATFARQMGVWDIGSGALDNKQFGLRTRNPNVDSWVAQCYGNADIIFNTFQATNNWTHIALTHDGTTTRAYVNGQLAATDTHISTLATTENPLRIGLIYNDNNSFEGQIDELKVFTGALSEAEVAAAAGFAETALYNPTNGQYYDVGSSSVGWTAAKAEAEGSSFQGMIGHMPVVNDAGENGFLTSLSNAGWLALNDVAVDGNWVWSVPGGDIPLATTGYTNWNTTEPNGGVNEYYVEMYDSGVWNDNSAAGNSNTLIEYDTAAGYPGFRVRQVMASGTIGDLNDVRDLLALSPGDAGHAGEASTEYYALNLLDLDSHGGDLARGGASFPIDIFGSDENNFAVEATGLVLIPNAGDWTFAVFHDDLFELNVNGVTASGSGSGLTTQTVNFASAGVYPLQLIFGEQTGWADLELFAAEGDWDGYDPLHFQLVGDVLNGGLALVPEPATLVLLLFGLIALPRLRRRR